MSLDRITIIAVRFILTYTPSLVASRGAAAVGMTEKDCLEGAQGLLREALDANLARVIPVFRRWDADRKQIGRVVVDEREFRRALFALQYTGSRESIATCASGSTNSCMQLLPTACRKA